MSEAAKLNIAVQRNEDYIPHEYRLTDINGDPINITGWSFNFHVNVGPGLSGALQISLGLVPSDAGSYIRVLEPENGSFELYVNRADIRAIFGPPDQDVCFAMNILATDSLGDVRCVARGTFTAEPGV